MFHRLEIRSKATNVAEIESKSIRGSVKTLNVVSRRAVRPGDICGYVSFVPTVAFMQHFFISFNLLVHISCFPRNIYINI